MQVGDVFFKTEAGKQEIQDRGHRLPSSLRSLLLMVDGQRDRLKLHEMMAGLHVPEDGLEQLLLLGLVRRNELPTTAALGPLPGQVTMPLEFGRYRRLYETVTDSVRRHLGLKGYFMQLKVEKCTNIEALLGLLPEIAVALAKSKDHAFASEWLSRTRGEVQA